MNRRKPGRLLKWRYVPRKGDVLCHWECEPFRFSIWRGGGPCGNRPKFMLLPGEERFATLEGAKDRADFRWKLDQMA